MSHPSGSATAVLPVQRHSCREMPGGRRLCFARTSEHPPDLDPGGFGLSAAVRCHFLRSGPIRRQCQRITNVRMARRPAIQRHAGWPKGCYHPGRFAAEWCTRRARVRRKSLLLRGRSGRRCDGSQDNPRSQCAAGRAYCDLRENYKMTAGPGSRGKVRACVPPTRERVHEISRHADVQPESGKSVVFGQS